jgi:CBS domain-containing protein
MDFLKTLKTPSPVFPNDECKLMWIDIDESIQNGFQLLVFNNVLALPVRDQSSRDNPYPGFFSMLDIVHHVVDTLGTLVFPEEDASEFMSLLTEKEQFRGHKVRQIMGLSKEPFVIVGEYETVDGVIRKMVDHKAHRALALSADKDKRLVNIITQSRLAECINELWDVDPGLSELGQKTISELDLGSKEVVWVSDSSRALDAFKLIKEKGISGVAVVCRDSTSQEHPHPKLVGNISTHDLMCVKSSGKYLKLLYGTVSDYLQTLKYMSPHTPRGLITCTPKDRLRDVLHEIVTNRVHRSYIVKSHEGNQLLGVISLTDILNRIVREERKQPTLFDEGNRVIKATPASG